MAEQQATSSAADVLADPPAAQLLVLESEALRVKVWPQMGGKIVSLVVRGHGTLAGSEDRELLHPPIHAYSAATGTSSFEDSDAGGWDECVPSVAACKVNGVAIPDHGDVWRLPWDAAIRNEALLAHVSATSVPLRFSRFLSLDGPNVHLRYSVVNTGSRSTDFLWSAHPLFQVEEGDRIVLPPSVDRVHVASSSVRDLVMIDGQCAWPLAELANGLHLDLSIVGPPDGVTSHKLFAGPLSFGWCGLYRERLQLGIIMRFDTDHIPFAGLWISNAAWPSGGRSSDGRQYTVALEPTTAPCDALDRAIELGYATHLLPQGEFSSPLQVEIFGSHTPLTYDEFVALAPLSTRH